MRCGKGEVIMRAQLPYQSNKSSEKRKLETPSSLSLPGYLKPIQILLFLNGVAQA